MLGRQCVSKGRDVSRFLILRGIITSEKGRHSIQMLYTILPNHSFQNFWGHRLIWRNTTIPRFRYNPDTRLTGRTAIKIILKIRLFEGQEKNNISCIDKT